MTLYIILNILLFSSLLLVAHTYVFYPLSLFLFYKITRNKSLECTEEYFPEVSVLIAAHNEGNVIEKKLQSILDVDYPREKLTVLIGSDNSTDDTNKIISDYSAQHPFIRTFFFDSRTGKPGIINFLAAKAKERSSNMQELVFIITDADITHSKSSFKLLTRHFQNPKVHLVDTHLKNLTSLGAENINESKYLEFEVNLKYWESVVFNRMMGPFGGCFAMKGNAFVQIPSNFLVDDFFLAMCVLERGNYVLTEIQAMAYEDSKTELSTEYKRKRRISAGNFQNLFRFKNLLFSKYMGLSYAFISHKVLRWLTPFLLLISLVTFLLLCVLGNPFYIFVAKIITIMLFVGVVIDFTILQLFKFGSITSKLLYFIIMNIALFHGFIDYIKGIRSNVWQPTKRSI